MLNAALTIAQLPAKTTVAALKKTTSPQALNVLSAAIAQAALQTTDQDEAISVEGVTVEIDFNEERLLTTAGISTAIALGTVYWIGDKLRIQYRYSAMVTALQTLRQALLNGDDAIATTQLRLIDNLSNPLVDPETFVQLDNADEVKIIYEQLFEKPAEPGSMFNANRFTSSVDESIQFLDTLAFTDDVSAARAVVISQTDDVLESMIKKAKPYAGKVGSRLVGAVLWVDTVWWVATSALDLGLNYLGIAEEDQRIPILADIPFIGPLFDLSDSVGSSFVDLVLTPVLDGIIGLFGAEEEVESLVDVMWGIITSAALNPTLAPFIIAILDFYIDDVKIDFDVPALFKIQSFGEIDYSIDLYGIRPDPLDILIAWLYLITGKIIFKWWILPAFRMLKIKKAPTPA